jgi:hypothetical protein
MIIDYLGSCFIYQQTLHFVSQFHHHPFTWWEWMMIQLSPHQMGLNLTSFVKIGLERNINFELKNFPNCSPYVFEQRNWRLIWKVSLGASKEQLKRKRSSSLFSIRQPRKKIQKWAVPWDPNTILEKEGLKSSAPGKLVSVSEFRHSRWRSWDGT